MKLDEVLNRIVELRSTLIDRKMLTLFIIIFLAVNAVWFAIIPMIIRSPMKLPSRESYTLEVISELDKNLIIANNDSLKYIQESLEKVDSVFASNWHTEKRIISKNLEINTFSKDSQSTVQSIDTVYNIDIRPVKTGIKSLLATKNIKYDTVHVLYCFVNAEAGEYVNALSQMDSARSFFLGQIEDFEIKNQRIRVKYYDEYDSTKNARQLIKQSLLYRITTNKISIASVVCYYILIVSTVFAFLSFPIYIFGSEVVSKRAKSVFTKAFIFMTGSGTTLIGTLAFS
ncbi:MAG: hypothetical protein AAGA64_03530 [Bacteroidota bacterium]